MTSQTTETPNAQGNRNGALPPHDIYTDPKMAIVPNSEDPIVKLARAYWKPVLSFVVAILVVVYFVTAFQDSYTASMSSAADVFKRIQTEYQNYSHLLDEVQDAAKESPVKEKLAKDPKAEQAANEKIEALKKQLAESKSKLDQLLNAASDSREPYKTLAVLYQALISRREGTFQSQALLAQFANWEKTGKPGSAERFYAELAAITLARANLDQPEQIENGRSILKTLAVKGEFVSASAADTLSLVATTPEQRAEAEKIINDLVKVHPEQADVLKQDAASTQ